MGTEMAKMNMFYKLGENQALQQMGLSEAELVELLQLLEQALGEEQHGQQQYSEISDRAEQAGAHSVANRADEVAQDEKRHEQMNQQSMQELRGGGGGGGAPGGPPHAPPSKSPEERPESGGGDRDPRQAGGGGRPPFMR
jgi:hypothetical protein